MDKRIVESLAKNFVGMMSNDPDADPRLKQILGDLMESDLKTLTHVATALGSALDAVEETKVEEGAANALAVSCDYLTVIDGTGQRRHLIFV